MAGAGMDDSGMSELLPFALIEEGNRKGTGTDPECFLDGIHLSQRLMPAAARAMHASGRRGEGGRD